MRTFIVAAAILGLFAPCQAQESSPSSGVRDRIAVGGLVTPALEGSGPWFMPGLRVSVPLGSRHGLDVDLGRVFGGTNKYGSIRRYHSAQVRFDRETTATSVVRSYWLAGIQHLPEREPDGRRKHHAAMTIGRGWRQWFSNGMRVTGEAAFSGGDGLMVYVAIGVLWAPKTATE